MKAVPNSSVKQPVAMRSAADIGVYEQQTKEGMAHRMNYYIRDDDSRYDQGYSGVTTKYINPGLYHIAVNKLKLRIPLSLPMIEKLGVLNPKGQHGHQAKELVYHALQLFTILEAAEDKQLEQLDQLDPVVLTELNFFFRLDILAELDKQGRQNGIC